MKIKSAIEKSIWTFIILKYLALFKPTRPLVRWALGGESQTITHFLIIVRDKCYSDHHIENFFDIIQYVCNDRLFRGIYTPLGRHRPVIYKKVVGEDFVEIGKS